MSAAPMILPTSHARASSNALFSAATLGDPPNRAP